VGYRTGWDGMGYGGRYALNDDTDIDQMTR
jgi:hypothetical protein